MLNRKKGTAKFLCAASLIVFAGAALAQNAEISSDSDIQIRPAAIAQQIYNCDTYGAACPSRFQNAMNTSNYSGEWWVVDYVNGLVWHYGVERVTGGASLTDLGVDAGTQTYVTAVKNMYAANHGTYAVYLESYQSPSGWVMGPPNGIWPQAVPGVALQSSGSCPAGSPNGPTDDGFLNAYDTVTNASYAAAAIANLNSAVNSWRASPAVYVNQLYNTMGWVMAGLTNSSIKMPNWSLRITVTFHDGSKRGYAYDGSQDSYLPAAGTAYDCSGNVIPENRRAIAGIPPATRASYYFPTPSIDFYNFVRNLDLYGIAHPTVTVGREATCVEKGGGVLVCN